MSVLAVVSGVLFVVAAVGLFVAVCLWIEGGNNGWRV